MILRRKETKKKKTEEERKQANHKHEPICPLPPLPGPDMLSCLPSHTREQPPALLHFNTIPPWDIVIIIISLPHNRLHRSATLPSHGGLPVVWQGLQHKSCANTVLPTYGRVRPMLHSCRLAPGYPCSMWKFKNPCGPSGTVVMSDVSRQVRIRCGNKP